MPNVMLGTWHPGTTNSRVVLYDSTGRKQGLIDTKDKNLNFLPIFGYLIWRRRKLAVFNNGYSALI